MIDRQKCGHRNGVVARHAARQASQSGINLTWILPSGLILLTASDIDVTNLTELT